MRLELIEVKPVLPIIPWVRVLFFLYTLCCGVIVTRVGDGGGGGGGKGSVGITPMVLRTLGNTVTCVRYSVRLDRCLSPLIGYISVECDGNVYIFVFVEKLNLLAK